MVLGLTLRSFTMIHVLISLLGIGSGLIVIYGFVTNKYFNRWTEIFLASTALTSITGFAFPFREVTPGIKLGIISLIVLALTLVARYPLHLRWRKTYVITACLALYFNVFVLVVQSFEKVPALKALAPTQKESPFAIAQLVVLAVFVVLTAISVRRFRVEPRTLTKSKAETA